MIPRRNSISSSCAIPQLSVSVVVLQEETRYEQNRTENLICIDRWRVWREMAEYGGVRRDMAEYGGIWREVKTPSKHLILSYYCIKEQFRNMWRDEAEDGEEWRSMAESAISRLFPPSVDTNHNFRTLQNRVSSRLLSRLVGLGRIF